MNDKIMKFFQMVKECENIVFFGGAGVSTDTVPLVPSEA